MSLTVGLASMKMTMRIMITLKFVSESTSIRQTSRLRLTQKKTMPMDNTMTTYGPSDTFIAQMGNIWDDTSAPNVEVIELTSKYRYRDNELENFDPTSPSGIHYTADRIEARFMEATIQSNDELDIEWSWETDYNIEFSGGVAALRQGNNQIALELDTQTGASTPMPLTSHSDFFGDVTAGDKLLAAINSLCDTELIAPVDMTLLRSNTVVIIYSWWVQIMQYWHAVKCGQKHSQMLGHILWTKLRGIQRSSIGFGAYSAVDASGRMDFSDYGTRLMEYMYKVDMSPEIGVQATYEPTTTIENWDRFSWFR